MQTQLIISNVLGDEASEPCTSEHCGTPYDWRPYRQGTQKRSSLSFNSVVVRRFEEEKVGVM